MDNLLNIIENIDNEKAHYISSHLLALLSKCIDDAGRYKLPSSFQSAVWSSFHELRCNQFIARRWDSFIASNAPPDVEESDQCLQLVMERMLKSLIKEKAKVLKRDEASAMNFRSPHTPKQLIHGRVRCCKASKEIQEEIKVQIKRDLFVCVLEGMKATNQPGHPDSPLEYTKCWSHMIDRGGLYHIKDNVFLFIELIERIVGQHISISSITSYVPGKNLISAIHEDVLGFPPVLFSWEKIAEAIPSKYEKYSMELLLRIVDLWITIRGYSFA